jgi:two-component system, cell cycle response regulator DivK
VSGPTGGLSPRPLPLVLIVDDNVDAREMYAIYLEHAGFRAAQAPDGETAIEMARRDRPAVILMDVTMPRMDGWEAARRLKADPETRSLPLIMLTAHAFEQHRQRAAATGADAYLAKPVLPDALAVEIRKVLAES